VPLIGALPQPITSAPLVLFIYLVLILLVVTAVTSAVVRNTLWAIGTFASTMAVLAVLYLTIAPFLLFAVQLVIYTTVSAGLLLGLLRQTTGLERPPISPFSRQWIVGGAVAAALGALLVLVLAATSWPTGPVNAGLGLDAALTRTYVVGLGVLVVILASAALGSGLLLVAPTLPSPRAGGSLRGSGPRR
jgi:NADH:ubiquinone oxidoreductase subunit 6 (subunit J)